MAAQGYYGETRECCLRSGRIELTTQEDRLLITNIPPKQERTVVSLNSKGTFGALTSTTPGLTDLAVRLPNKDICNNLSTDKREHLA